MKEKISIIIPVYNVAHYLPRCMESVINQTYTNLEIILVDDGSIDESGKICDTYAQKDKRIKVIHKKNGGLSDARNKGLKIATGRYIGFVDSDDYIDKDMYELLYKIIYAYNADIAECRIRDIWDEEDIKKSNKSDTEIIEQFDTLSALEELILSRKFKVNVYNKIYKRELLNGIEFPFKKINEDEFWTYKIFAKAEKIICCDTYKYYHTHRKHSITQSYDYQGNMDKFYALTERLDFINNNFNTLFNLTQRKFFLFIFGKYTFLEKNKHLDKDKKYRNEIKNYILDNYNSLYSNPLMGKDKFFIKLFKYSPKISLTVLRIYNTLKSIAKKILGNNYSYLRELKKIKEKSSCRREFLKKINSIPDKERPVAYIMLLPEHGNMGDQAIAIAEKKFIKDILPDYSILEILINDTSNLLGLIKKNIKTEDIIFLHGGGNIGDIYMKNEIFRRKIIKCFKNNKIISFPQTIHFSSSKSGLIELEKSKKIYNNHSNLLLTAREETSYAIMKNIFPKNKVILTPDMVLYLNEQDKKDVRENIFVCLRSDRESIISCKDRIELLIKLREKYKDFLSIGDTVIKKKILIDNREIEFEKLLNSFRKSRVVITDRLHGMIFCAITGTPCIVLQNYNHKIMASYDWLKDREYIVLVKEFNLEKILELTNKFYNFDSEKIQVIDLKDKFSELATEAKLMGIKK